MMRIGSKAIDVVARVRSNTGSAAFVGALLIVYGFFWFRGPGETDTGPLLVGSTMFHWTLRLGGILLITIAVWCSIGVPIALLLHTILSALVGALLAVSGALMMIGGGFGVEWIGYVIYIICGVTLITTGVQDFRDYCRLPSEDEADRLDDAVDALAAFDEPFEESPLMDLRPPSASKRAAGKHRSAGTSASTSDSYLARLTKKDRPSRR